MKHGRLTFADLKSVWRILVTVLACQLIGSAISLALAPHHFWFRNFWQGGALATLPGFVLGVIWQIKSSSAKTNRDWVLSASFLGLVAIGLTVFALGIDLPRMRTEMKNVHALNQWQSTDVQKIEVFDEDGRKHLTQITDPESLASFAQGISDADGHSPNHPYYSHSWYVVVTGPVRREFKLHINPRYPNSVIGYFVRKSESGNATWFHGTFESKGLRPWAQNHLLPLDVVNANDKTGDSDIEDIFRATVPASHDSSSGRSGQ